MRHSLRTHSVRATVGLNRVDATIVAKEVGGQLVITLSKDESIDGYSTDGLHLLSRGIGESRRRTKTVSIFIYATHNSVIETELRRWRRA